MSSKFLVVGIICVCFAGCASSNGGGLVVGNPLVSESAAKDASKCDCASSKDPKVKKACKCASDSGGSY